MITCNPRAICMLSLDLNRTRGCGSLANELDAASLGGLLPAIEQHIAASNATPAGDQHACQREAPSAIVSWEAGMGGSPYNELILLCPNVLLCLRFICHEFWLCPALAITFAKYLLVLKQQGRGKTLTACQPVESSSQYAVQSPAALLL